ncbi:hypothetical protein RchiOBHm_Chr3g0492701 [Rosa chinensis]|uniref:Uncharacterized protein n=1 Tax=Rosa chinensis TaxID=74649 RepID=A0A2P6RGK2_ROSCH|nr:hypothetical protein RchiOBHm_Chr3g0492701 [Rosa chinensis]
MLYGIWSTPRPLHISVSSCLIRLSFGQTVFWVLGIFTVISVSGSNSRLLTFSGSYPGPRTQKHDRSNPDGWPS